MRVGLHSVLEEFVLIWLLAKEFTVLLNGEDFHVGVEVLEKTTATPAVQLVIREIIVWFDNLDEPDVAAGDGLAACAPPCGGESVVRIIAEVVALLVEYHGLAFDCVDTKQVWLVGSVHAPKGVLPQIVSLDWAKVANVTFARCLVHMTMTLIWGLEMLASGVTVLFVPLVLVEGDAVLGGVCLWKVLKLSVDEQGRDISSA